MLFRRDPGPAEESAGFFQRLRKKLNRGSSWLTDGLVTLFRGRKIDAQVLEELEARLLTADVGVEATEFILKDLRNRRVALPVSWPMSRRC
jgi:fused signal recognition particle receptor